MITPDQVTVDKPLWGTDNHDISNADILPTTKGKYLKNDLNYDDLHSVVNRTIEIVNPDGTLSKNSVVQTVKFKRSAIANAVDGTVKFTDWVPDGNDGFKEINVPTIAGYKATQTNVPVANGIKQDYRDPYILITYKGNPNNQVITYKDANGKIVGQQTVNGNNGQTVAVATEVRDGFI